MGDGRVRVALADRRQRRPTVATEADGRGGGPQAVGGGEAAGRGRRPRGAGIGTPTVTFAHASEAEMARILDFYRVRWEYEPRTFPIRWTPDGRVVESFTPDFYLPEFDLYIELTTLKQRLVRKKNRKLRHLRELYPDLRVKLLYARDFRALLFKYGRSVLAEALSGASGQGPALGTGEPAGALAASSTPRS